MKIAIAVLYLAAAVCQLVAAWRSRRGFEIRDNKDGTATVVGLRDNIWLIAGGLILGLAASVIWLLTN